ILNIQLIMMINQLSQ
ncbi:hypothetical protein ACTFIY_006489, partial [Dictyostelium cf. discoideum]